VNPDIRQHELPPAVRRVLDAVRRQIRAYVWWQGIALTVLVAGVAFWVGLVIDRSFEPSVGVRQLGLLLVGIALAYVAWRYIVRRIVVPISDASAASLL
jgi:hypothetical protein